MSIQYMENFSNYGSGAAGTANMLDNLPWAGINETFFNLPVDPDGLSSGRVFYIDGGSNNYIGGGDRIALPTPDGIVGVAARFWFSFLPTTNASACGIVNFANISNQIMYQLRVMPNGALNLYRTASLGSNPETEIATTTVPVISPGAWNHLEICCDTDNGDIEVRKEGVVIPALSVSDTTYTDDIGIVVFSDRHQSGTASAGNVYMKDLVVWDGSGSVNNNFVGPVSVYTLAVDGDVSSGWVPSTGSSDYQILDSNPPNDAEYISADDSPPAPSVMTISNLPADVVSIRGLQTVVRMQKSDGGDATVQVSLTSNSVDDDGADRPITTTFAYWLDISEINPDTLSPWTPIEVNDATVKINRTT